MSRVRSLRIDAAGKRIPSSKILRWPAWVAVTAVTAVVTGGCGVSGSSGGHADAGSVVIGWEGGLGDPFDVTVGNGYLDKRLGSNADLKLFASGPPALAALSSGALQYMCGFGLPPAISAIAKGVPIEIVFAQERYTTGDGLAVKKNSGITSVADLKGKTLGLVVGSTASFELAQYLEGSGVSPSDVKQLNMTPQQIQSAWTTGRISAALTWNPAFSYLVKHDGVALKTDADLPRNASTYNVCVANKDYAAAHPDTTVKFMHALGDGVDFVKTNRQKALKIMAKETGTDVPTATAIFDGYETFSLAEQGTANALGTPGGAASSAVAQSLISNWGALHDEGFQSANPPTDAGKYVNGTYAAKASGTP